MNQVQKYYDENAQREWERLDRHPFEFIFTTYIMDQHIQPGDSVLDIGGGPGRYSIYYAQKGCDVTLVDLSAGNIALVEEKAGEAGAAFDKLVGNCLNLDEMNLGQYDHVFLMGPLYHLLEKSDREKAVQLAIDHLKPGGILYCSFILDFAAIIYDLKNGPGLFPAEIGRAPMQGVIASVISGTEYAGASFTSACFMNQRQIEPFMQPFGLEKLHLFGQEGILAPNEPQVKSYPQEEFDLWVETAKKFLEIPEYMAFSEHAMYVGRKAK